jgi:hypothetical protein
VLDGECIQGARFLGEDDRGFLFAVADNASKFRPGDPLVASDGLDLDAARRSRAAVYDAQTGTLRCEPDPFQRDAEIDLVEGRSYVLDRRPFGLQGRLRDAVQAAFRTPFLAKVLTGEHALAQDEGALLRAREALAAFGLNDAQIAAGAAAIATESLALVQGPPGTGKTRLLAAVVAALCRRTCRIALCAFTHRAVGNALLAIRAAAPELPVYKLASSSSDDHDELRAAGVQIVDARRVKLPEKGCVVAGTCYQLAKLQDRERFHYTVFDEAGQLPIPHALPGMLRAQRWLFFGDHAQLPPVVATAHADRVASVSIFEHLHERYGSHLLDTTYRLNDGVCRVVSESFYGGRLRRGPGGSGAARAVPRRRPPRRRARSGAPGGVAAHRPPAAGRAFAGGGERGRRRRRGPGAPARRAAARDRGDRAVPRPGAAAALGDPAQGSSPASTSSSSTPSNASKGRNARSSSCR